MTDYHDLKDFCEREKFDRFIIAADAETRVGVEKNGKLIEEVPAGGVSVALDPVAKATNAIYIARGRTDVEKRLGGFFNKSEIEEANGKYTLKRIFFKKEEIDDYYLGFSNSTLWPLCHIAFQPPVFNDKWFRTFKKVNKDFADNIKKEIKGKTFVWVNDYQLAFVPSLLPKNKNLTIAMFWHIPWPTWEIFRVLPYKKELLEGMLSCDFIAFHRGYQARNFLDTVERELAVQIDQETSTVRFGDKRTVVKSLPMGIDTDVIENIVGNEEKDTLSGKLIKFFLKEKKTEKTDGIYALFNNYKVMLGVDRFDYTKGLRLRMMAIDRFFEKNEKYKGKVVYVGILAPSRKGIPAYDNFVKDVCELIDAINKKHQKGDWKPIHAVVKVFSRPDILEFYKKASLCLVTPLDDGMNLVSKEYVLASSFSSNPGMLVLSQFAGSAIDLSRSLIVNPYDIESLADAIKQGLEMDKNEIKKRIMSMRATLEDRNIYQWALDFIKNGIEAKNRI